MTSPSPATATTFPKHFTWGAASAAYQIEGARSEDGKGASVWDMFCERPGAVLDGHTGAVACDHYHRLEQDVSLMRGLGIQAYRLSLSWPRIIPDGTGALNEKGLDFYERLVDALLARDITPWITLFHWDYPLELFHRGGWLNRDSADWFGDYVGRVVSRLSDRVTNYFTLNEPQVYIGLGHLEGIHAPGLKLPLSGMLRAGHHTLLAHGRAVQAARAHAKQELTLGYAPVALPKTPASNAPADIERAREATFCSKRRDGWTNSWWMDPVLLGHYPEGALDFYGPEAPEIRDGDMEIISQPIDILGVNIYESRVARARGDGKPGYQEGALPVGGPRTAFNWPVTPEALYWGPRFLHERYGKPIYITENGLSGRDWVSLDGKVHDQHRIDFTTRYLQQLHASIQDGTDVRGYFHWSIMDNFEWAAGYHERFGLVHVDYETLKRTPKESFHWYRGVIESNGGTLSA